MLLELVLLTNFLMFFLTNFFNEFLTNFFNKFFWRLCWRIFWQIFQLIFWQMFFYDFFKNNFDESSLRIILTNLDFSEDFFWPINLLTIAKFRNGVSWILFTVILGKICISDIPSTYLLCLVNVVFECPLLFVDFFWKANCLSPMKFHLRHNDIEGEA